MTLYTCQVINLFKLVFNAIILYIVYLLNDYVYMFNNIFTNWYLILLLLLNCIEYNKKKYSNIDI